MFDVASPVPTSANPPMTDAGLLARLDALAPQWSENAARLDSEGRVPALELQQLHHIGAFTAPLPASLGGLGLGTEPAGAAGLLEVLRRIGSANLSLGRIFEGHVNALKLVMRYGTPEQRRRAAEDALGGHLFAIWATEGNDPVRMAGTPADAVLHGTKMFCSAAAHATRALITLAAEDGAACMALVPLRQGERARGGLFDTHGMRGCGTGNVEFTGVRLTQAAVIGQPGDYLRQPEFSAGAWRASAVALGGLDAMVEQLRRQLVARDRQDNPHQRARLGEALIAAETAALWTAKAAAIAEGDAADPGEVAAYVNLARIAVENACLDAMRLVQRSLGLAAFVRPNQVERLLRDLATYLRQPAPDETLTEAAGWFTTHALPGRTVEAGHAGG